MTWVWRLWRHERHLGDASNIPGAGIRRHECLYGHMMVRISIHSVLFSNDALLALELASCFSISSLRLDSLLCDLCFSPGREMGPQGSRQGHSISLPGHDQVHACNIVGDRCFNDDSVIRLSAEVCGWGFVKDE